MKNIIKENTTMKALCPRGLNHLKEAKLITKLGSGGFADVYRYKCTQLHDCDKCYVVKSLRMDEICLYYHTSTIQKELLNEYEIGHKLIHNNILQTIDIDLNGTSLVLEDFVGIDFLDYLNLDETRNVPLLIKLFAQVLDALDYMHTKEGIAHMDIKLENIIWNRETDIVKIIDFGHARKFRKNGEEYTYRDGYVGTKSYFPPEYFKKDEWYTPSKVDAWCCGIVLYNLVYDKVPWEVANVKEDKAYADYEECLSNGLSTRHIFEDTTTCLPQSDTACVWTVMNGLLHPDATKRYSIRNALSLIKMCSFMKN